MKVLQGAMDYWERSFGVRSWPCSKACPAGQTEELYRGDPGNFEFSWAYAFAGGTMIEIARHDVGESAYAEGLERLTG